MSTLLPSFIVFLELKQAKFFWSVLLIFGKTESFLFHFLYSSCLSLTHSVFHRLYIILYIWDAVFSMCGTNFHNGGAYNRTVRLGSHFLCLLRGGDAETYCTGNVLCSFYQLHHRSDIGGEVVVKGKNPSNNLWRIGINKPVDDSLAVNQDLQTILEISDLGLATSGNYRNYYYKDGKKYAHTIDPRTGYPVQHSILSSTVIAKDCMTADALATAFMVMGLEKAETFCKANPEIDAYFIYSGENGEFKTYYTEGMKKYIAK